MRQTLLQTATLKALWRSQILRRRHGLLKARKGLIASLFIDQSESHAPYVDIHSLLVLVLYEDEFRTPDGVVSERTPLRLCGYSAQRRPHGVQWGGVENSRLFKDLTVIPRCYAEGQRIDLRKEDLLGAALELDRRLARVARYPAMQREGLRLPQLWAGFRADRAGFIHGEGPEFELACRQSAVSAELLFSSSARDFEGLKLWPLEWVSGQLEHAATVFAEMAGFWRSQAARIGSFPEGLMGFQGASEFDFYHNQYRRMPWRDNGDTIADRSSDRSHMPGDGGVLSLPVTSVPPVQFA